MSKVITKVIETPVRCVVCQGSGESITDKTKPCKGCDGDGVNFITEETTTTKKPDQVDLSVGDLLKGNPVTTGTTYYHINYETCPNCQGTGKVNGKALFCYDTQTCDKCFGLGKVIKDCRPSIYPNYRPWWGIDWGYSNPNPHVTYRAADTNNGIKYSAFNVSDKAL